MPIAATGTIVTTGVAATTVLRIDPTDVNPAPRGTPPPPLRPPESPESPLPDATVTALSDEARTRQATAGRQPAPAAGASGPTLTAAVSSDWAAGVPAVDGAVIKQALEALDEASRARTQAAIDAAATQRRDEADRQQKAVLAAAAAETDRQDAIVLAALNAGIRLAYGALPASLADEPMLQAPIHLNVIV